MRGCPQAQASVILRHQAAGMGGGEVSHPPTLKPHGHTAPYEPELPEWRRQPGMPQPALTNSGDFSCQPHCPHTASPGFEPLEGRGSRGG